MNNLRFLNKFYKNNLISLILLLLIGGIGATSTVFSIAHAQTPTLGEPIL